MALSNEQILIDKMKEMAWKQHGLVWNEDLKNRGWCPPSCGTASTTEYNRLLKLYGPPGSLAT